uniref:coiled-coil domain-containing protein 134-like n=1 Tax=Styela clava TaxID=7725 RepID=UPI00193A0438|nr:coiled-coil domain-containing protein 134-like [Styela clava]
MVKIGLIILFLATIFSSIFADEAKLDTESKKLQNGTKTPIEIYRNMFKMKRRDQIRAIESLLIMDDVEKQHKMIGIMMKTIEKTIVKGKQILMEENYKAGDPFPEKIETKEGFSMVLENTALFTDLIVRFPFVAQRELKQNTDWKETIIWGKNVCEKSGVFTEKHQKILHSLGQELKIDEPDPSYENPFKIKPEVDQKTEEERQKEYEDKKRKEKLAAKKKNKKSGPKLSKHEL